MSKFKVSIMIVLFLGLFLAASTGVFAETHKVDVPLTNPGKPALIKVNIINGSIFVTGYSGKTVAIEVGPQQKGEGNDGDEHEVEVDMDEDDDDKDAAQKRKGMMKIGNTSSGLNIVEEDNVVNIRVNSYRKAVSFRVKVPFKSSLKLSTVNNGKIVVEKVDGELSVSNVNGPITLTNVGGTVLTNTVNGDLKVTLDRVNLDKPMSFSSFNGDVDVTFPGTAKFNLKMKSDQGEIYSDFKLAMIDAPKAGFKKTEKKGKGFRLKIEKSVYGKMNGGGQEISFKSFNGDIYIRKK